MKNWLKALTLGLCLFVVSPLFAQPGSSVEWPLWETFKTHFIQEDGRVLDASTPQQQSTSEGQSYGMFFALVANDQTGFEQLWQWSVKNLFSGDASAQLPAWLWGKNEKNEWQILDNNSASDADVWFVYTLLEAGRLWDEPKYTQAGYDLLALVELNEVIKVPEIGVMLIPGEKGFVHKNQWILNSSYLFTPLFNRLQLESPLSPWGEIATNSLRLLQQTTPMHFAADWVTFEKTPADKWEFLLHKPKQSPIGSYDAIRNYMWAGMTPKDDPTQAASLQALIGMRDYLKSGAVAPPEKVNVLTGETQGTGSFGFSASLLPYLKALGETELLEQQKRRVEVLLRQSILPANVEKKQPPYYDFVLSLFGLGWVEDRYSFDIKGRVSTLWEKSPCQLNCKK